MTDSRAVPALRIRTLVDRPPRPEGEFVLYWMIAARRLEWSFALDRALELATGLRRPLLVLEPLRAGYRHASDRLHAFVLQGMAANERRSRRAPISYVPYVEPTPGSGKGLLAALSRRAAAIVTDDFPGFFLPRMLSAAARQVDCRLEAVDSNGLLPLGAADRAFPTAYSFRRFLHGHLKRHLLHPPQADPLAALRLPRLAQLPPELTERWPRASEALLAARSEALAELPIDHDVPPVAERIGGAEEGARRVAEFVERRLDRYADERNDPDRDGASGLSPWLHFGHVSPHAVFAAIAERTRLDPETLPERGIGAREGWWGLDRSTEAFLDQLVTWRELGLQFARHRPDDHDRFASIPDWAQATLARHAGDPRAPAYDLPQLEAATTYDELWNAAQRELATTGTIQNYLRMLWGKKILEWGETPERAAEHAVALNDRWALDGRDPNSYSGIFWCFGRHDRPWGPERPIFGTVRYMSSANTRRKLELARYLDRFGATPSLFAPP